MSNIYTWTITSMATMPSPNAQIDDYVVKVNYTVTGANDTNTTSIQGSKEFDLTNASPKPYSSLTEAEVISWIQDDPNLVINMQANIDAVISPETITTIKALPWV